MTVKDVDIATLADGMKTKVCYLTKSHKRRMSKVLLLLLVESIKQKKTDAGKMLNFLFLS